MFVKLIKPYRLHPVGHVLECEGGVADVLTRVLRVGVEVKNVAPAGEVAGVATSPKRTKKSA